MKPESNGDSNMEIDLIDTMRTMHGNLLEKNRKLGDYTVYKPNTVQEDIDDVIFDSLPNEYNPFLLMKVCEAVSKALDTHLVMSIYDTFENNEYVFSFVVLNGDLQRYTVSQKLGNKVINLSHDESLVMLRKAMNLAIKSVAK